MSVINQVLKDLDKRGASTNIGEATIRVVHTRSRRSAMLLVTAGALGILAAGAGVWIVWQGEQIQPMPVADSLQAVQAVVLPVSQPAIVQVLFSSPRIKSVSPEKILASGVAQLVSINGSDFREDATVTLYDSDGYVYENRPIVSLSPAMIVLQLNFGRDAGKWQVEVRNADGGSSKKFAFDVISPVSQQKASVVPSVAAPARVLPVVPVLKVEAEGGVNKQPTQITPQQKAENEFRRAYQLMRQGRNADAMGGYENALQLDPGHEQARLNMVNLLLGNKHNTEAEQQLKDGLQLNPQQTGFAMLLARLQVERSALQLALDTLKHSLPYAEKQAEYHSFVAALLQRQNNHREAVSFYQKALQLKPNTGVWLMGVGISLRAEKRNEEARDAFKRALDTNTLNADLQSFVIQQLKELKEF